MRLRSFRLLGLACFCCCLPLVALTAWAQNNSDQPPGSPPPSPPTPVSAPTAPLGQDATTPAAPGPIEPLLRGPVHEGFAEMVRLTPQPIPPVGGQPPQPINELPPDVKPDNANAEWLPGYWGWNSDGKRFIWISGTWRVPPPGTRWVPGYWTTTDTGAQWVPGFWVPAETQQISYLPAPPAYEDEGVDTNSPPSPDVFWVPGVWDFAKGNYGWQPGYWARAVPGWVWIAAHYQWTPQGYVFLDGRWDYPIDERGMLFTPVAFQSPLYQQAGFSFSPGYLVDPSLLVDNLFADPTYQNYYFGDYYGNQYQQAGIYPWYAVGTGAYLYDPIFAYRSWYDRRRNPHWRDDLRRRYDRLVQNPAGRPPRTWQAEQRLARAGGRTGTPFRPFVTPIDQALRSPAGRNFVRLSDAQRREARQNTDFRRSLANDRSRLERPLAGRPAVRPETRPNPRSQPTFRLPPVRTTTHPMPEEREPVRRAPVANRGEEMRPETRTQPRLETRPNLEEHRQAPITGRQITGRDIGGRDNVPRPEPRVAMPPRRPERVATPQRTAPARRAAPAPRNERRP